MPTAWQNLRRYMFGYDAAASSTRRRNSPGIMRSEDAELNRTERRRLIDAGRDLQRNFAIAAWMVRRHLDYVTNFSFKSNTGNDTVDDALEAFVRWWSEPAHCDVTRRHTLPQIIRLAEARATLDGDIFLVKTAAGLLQVVEGDRVRTPEGGVNPSIVPDAAKLIHGVEVDAAGAATRYAVCKRRPATDMQPGMGGFEFERMVPAEFVYHHAIFDRFDQVRGISPLATAFNTLKDVYQGFDYALAKMKVAQLFAMAAYRGSGDAMGGTVDNDTDPIANVDFGKGPVVLDLDQGDKMEAIESRSPSNEFQQFSQTMISVALKALDIPYSFYAENFTNYSGARQALLQYELSASQKRSRVLAMLNHLTRWRLGLAIDDGLIRGAKAKDLAFEWIHHGTGWIDPLKEVQANAQAISAGLTSRTRLLREQGQDFYDVADELAAEKTYLEKLGLPTQVTVPAPSTPDNAAQQQELVNA